MPHESKGYSIVFFNIISFIPIHDEKDHWSAMVPAQINILYKIFVKPKDFFYLNFVSKQSHFLYVQSILDFQLKQFNI